MGLRALLNGAIRKEELRTLDRLALELAGLYLLKAGVNFCGPVLLRLTGERIVWDLRRKVSEHLHRLDLAFFADQRVGDLTSRLLNDVSLVRSAVTDTLAAFVSISLRMLGAMVVMLMLDWRLSLVPILKLLWSVVRRME
jgi:subfamily B ATP-binding cassette protein MsbA